MEYKQPAPSGQAADVIQSMKDASGNESRKCSGQDVACIENGNASGDLFASVEDGEHIQCPWVIRRLCDTEKKSGEKQSGEILRDCSKGGDNGPQGHAECHVIRRLGAGKEHVRRHLAEQIANEKDRNTSLVLGTGEVEVIFQIIQSGEGNGISIKVVKPIFCIVNMGPILGVTRNSTYTCDLSDAMKETYLI